MIVQPGRAQLRCIFQRIAPASLANGGESHWHRIVKGCADEAGGLDAGERAAPSADGEGKHEGWPSVAAAAARRARRGGTAVTLVNGSRVPISRSAWRRAWRALRSSWLIFMPEGYPHTVHPQYFAYSAFNFANSITGSAITVLSTQALLHTLKLSTGNSMALNATMNWIIKDGLGQLGGIAIVAIIGGRFDISAKKYRFLGALLLVLACLMEIALPLLPEYFVFGAATANIVKNVSWMATAATRAQIYRHFARCDNMGDLFAKCASQNTLASIFGMVLGLSLSYLFVSGEGSGAPDAPKDGLSAMPAGTIVFRCLRIFAPLAAICLGATYLSCTYATSPRLSLGRLEAILRLIQRRGLDGERIGSGGGGPQTLEEHAKALRSAISRIGVAGPDVIGKGEPILFSLSSTATAAFSRITLWSQKRQPYAAPLEALLPELVIEPLIEEIDGERGRLGEDALLVSMAPNGSRRYWMRLERQPSGAISRICIWYAVNATTDDTIHGLLVGLLLRLCIIPESALLLPSSDGEQGLPGAAHERGRRLVDGLSRIVDDLYEAFKGDLIRSGWSLGDVYLGKRRPIHVEYEDGGGDGASLSGTGQPLSREEIEDRASPLTSIVVQVGERISTPHPPASGSY